MKASKDAEAMPHPAVTPPGNAHHQLSIVHTTSIVPRPTKAGTSFMGVLQYSYVVLQDDNL